MPMPSVRAIGPDCAGTGDVTVTLPTHAIDDILKVYIESHSGETATISTAGWAQVDDSPQEAVDGAVGSRITVWWKRATSASETDPVVTDPGNHAVARAVSYQNCITTGDPWNVTSGGATSAGAAQAAAGATTTVPNCLVVVVISTTNNVTAEPCYPSSVGSFTNADLANIAEIINFCNTAGNGGGMFVVTGEKAAAGAYGDTSFDSTGNTNPGGYITMALMPEPDDFIPTVTML